MEEAIKQYIEDEIKENPVLYASVFGINTAQVATAVAAFIEVARVMSGQLTEAFETMRIMLNEYNFAIEQFSVIEKKKQVHKLSLARPIIKHQVLNRKPKRLIKKIIH